ncbi:MAG: NAD(P)H dehydrogenase, partial [Burkholderiales bacterium]|nr:NAD(P)H dehydrogenase [Burkholderiales bacterium]
FYGARSASEADVKSHVETFAQRLGSYPDWPEIEEIDACVACPVPESDRPAEIDELDKAAASAFHAAVTHGLANASADNHGKKAA